MSVMVLSEPELVQIIAKVGRPRSRSPVLIPVDTDKAKAMLEAGFSWNQVGEYFDCSGMTIRRRLQPKPRREGARLRLLDLPLWWLQSRQP